MDNRHKIQLTLGQDYFLKGDYVKAEETLKELLTEHRGFADIYHMLGVIYHSRQEFDKAQDCFEQALSINPAYTEAALNLAVTYNDMGKYADAKRIYNEAISRTRNQPRALDPFVKGKLANMHADVGDAYQGLGLLDEAAREYLQALTLCPTFVDIRTKLANIYRDMGHSAQALREYEQVKQSNASYVPGLIQYGIALFAAGQKDQARTLWQEVLNQEPQNKSAAMYLKMASH